MQADDQHFVAQMPLKPYERVVLLRLDVADVRGHIQSQGLQNGPAEEELRASGGREAVLTSIRRHFPTFEPREAQWANAPAWLALKPILACCGIRAFDESLTLSDIKVLLDAAEPRSEADYEAILSNLTNMATVMERNPASFVGMEEEDFRNHFLVQLNGQYRGQATGETFNNKGKTDILIRVDGKNIFIAECKFWRGPESMSEALTQLLGYTTWRDKTIALLVFNRNKDFSAVLEKIQSTVKAHPQHLRQMSQTGETNWRYAFRHQDDASREISLTVLAFEVPV